MKPSRFLLAGLAAAFAGAATPALAQSCIQPSEKTAFDVRALQSQLMVVALTCKHEDVYNEFVKRYNPQLHGAYKTIDASYRRAGGQKALDSYITSLANVQSQEGIRMGSRFCQNSADLIKTALEAPNDVTALSRLAVANNLSNPHGRPECATTTAAVTRPAVSSGKPQVRKISATTKKH
ncbi:hypothetical protein ACX4MT_21535 [Roseomonas mucosa]